MGLWEIPAVRRIGKRCALSGMTIALGDGHLRRLSLAGANEAAEAAFIEPGRIHFADQNRIRHGQGLL